MVKARAGKGKGTRKAKWEAFLAGGLDGPAWRTRSRGLRKSFAKAARAIGQLVNDAPPRRVAPADSTAGEEEEKGEEKGMGEEPRQDPVAVCEACGKAGGVVVVNSSLQVRFVCHGCADEEDSAERASPYCVAAFCLA